jgi:cytidine deaminase
VIDAQQMQTLLLRATQVRQQAHCPYSSFAVGAALLTTAGEIFTGCNVENASFGLSVCAERNAIAAAVAGGMLPGALSALALVADTPAPVAPCGACLQVMAEFAAEGCQLVCATLDGRVLQQQFTALLPRAFSM